SRVREWFLVGAASRAAPQPRRGSPRGWYEPGAARLAAPTTIRARTPSLRAKVFLVARPARLVQSSLSPSDSRKDARARPWAVGTGRHVATATAQGRGQRCPRGGHF